MSYATEVAADSPLTWYRLGEAAGSASGADNSGNGHGITYTGGTLGVAGLVNDADTAYQTAGASCGTVTAASAAWANLTTLTIEAWFKTSDATHFQSIVDRDTQSANRQFQFRISNAGEPQFIGFSAASPTTITGATSKADGQRHQMVAVINGTAIKIRLDKVDVASGTMPGTLDSGSTNLLGIAHSLASSATQVFNGTVDEIAIYGTALSDARIDAHFDATTAMGGTATGRATATGSLTTPKLLAGTAAGQATVAASLAALVMSGAFGVAASSAVGVDGSLVRVGIPTRLLRARERAREELDPTGLTGAGV